MSFGASTPVSPHTMLAEPIPIEEPTYEVLQEGATDPVSLTKDVRTTIWSKTITVPEGKTEVFISARARMAPDVEVDRTMYVAIDGVDLGSMSEVRPGWWWYWLCVSDWLAVSPGTHTVTIDILCAGEGYTGWLWTDYACVMVCRVPDSKYVSFSNTDVRDVLSRAKKVKIMVGVNGITSDTGRIGGFVKVTDKFGNEYEEYLEGAAGTAPILYTFPFYDTVTVEVCSLDPDSALWISYLNIIYEF